MTCELDSDVSLLWRVMHETPRTTQWAVSKQRACEQQWLRCCACHAGGGQQAASAAAVGGAPQRPATAGGVRRAVGLHAARQARGDLHRRHAPHSPPGGRVGFFLFCSHPQQGVDMAVLCHECCQCFDLCWSFHLTLEEPQCVA